MLVLLCVHLLLLFSFSSAKDEEAKQNVSITKWQYCMSCKETVNLYIQVTTDEITNMQKAAKPPLATLEANDLVHLICDNKLFESRQPFMKYGCMKLLEDNRLDFLNQFAGQISLNDILNKAENYKRKRRICVKHAKACAHSEFKKANLTKAERYNKCTACRILGEDIENYHRQFKKIDKFKSFLQESYCSQLGFNFSPYLWLEELCEEMVEDHLKDILDILKLQAGIMSTGMNPSESSAEMMCKEFYRCKKPAAPVTATSEDERDDDEEL